MKEKKAFSENDDRFVLVYQMVNFHLLLLILEFSKSIMNFIELFLTLYQAEHQFSLFFKEVDHFPDRLFCLSCSLGKLVFNKEINDDRPFKQGESFAWWKYWCRFLDNQSTEEIENGSLPWSLKFQKGCWKFYGKVDWKAQGMIFFEVFSTTLSWISTTLSKVKEVSWK